MKLRLVPILFLAFFFVLNGNAQDAASNAQPVMTFESIIYDFGVINEEDGPVTHNFTFQNTGNSDLKIDSVKASCGCTTPGWTQNTITPNTDGVVTARFDPKNRPGKFEKYLTVFSNTEQRITQLLIRGEVIGRQKTIADTLVTKLGALRLKSQALNFDKITTEKPITKVFEMYNDSTEAFTFLEPTNLPPHIQVAIEPMTLEAKARGTITVTYDPNIKNDYGYVFDYVILNTNEPQSASKQLYTVATIEEYFPEMTEEELAKAPVIEFEKLEHHFGDVPKGQSVSTTFSFTNVGQSDLFIRKSKASCGCTATQPDKTQLKPGETGTITVTYNGSGKGEIQKKVTIYSNAPGNPVQGLMIKANVLVN